MLRQNHIVLDVAIKCHVPTFGMSMPGRQWTASDYRYSMNGQEHENAIFKGAMSAEYWMYDSRIGRRWNLDPIVLEWESPYATFANNPIYFSDYNGLTPQDPDLKKGMTKINQPKQQQKQPAKGKVDESKSQEKTTHQPLDMKPTALPTDALSVKEPEIGIQGMAKQNNTTTNKFDEMVSNFTSGGILIMPKFNYLSGHDKKWEGQEYMRMANFNAHFNFDIGGEVKIKGFSGGVGSDGGSIGLGPVKIGNKSGDFVAMGWGETNEYYTEIVKSNSAMKGSLSVTTFTNVYEYHYTWHHAFYRTTIQLQVNRYPFFTPGQAGGKQQVKDTIFKGWTSPSLNFGPMNLGVSH